MASSADLDQLIAKLHIGSLRAACDLVGHHQGLSTAARALFRAGHIDLKVRRQLVNIDTSFHVSRRLTAPKVDSYLAMLRGLLSSSAEREGKKDDVGPQAFEIFETFADAEVQTVDAAIRSLRPEVSDAADEGAIDLNQVSAPTSAPPRKNVWSTVDLPERFGDVPSSSDVATLPCSEDEFYGISLANMATQSDISLPQHDSSCWVTADPLCATLCGLSWLAQQSIASIAECHLRVAQLIDVGDISCPAYDTIAIHHLAVVAEPMVFPDLDDVALECAMVVSALERFEASVANVELHVSTLNVVTKCAINESIFDAFHPDGWFSERLFEWQQTFQDWRNLQRDWKDAGRRGSLQDVAAASPFCSFAYEAWALLNIRLELHLLMVAFRQGSDNTSEKLHSHQTLANFVQEGLQQTIHTRELRRQRAQ